MYKSEIRPSQIKKLSEKVHKLNYEKYLYKVNLIKCRAFEDQLIELDFPVLHCCGELPEELGSVLDFISQGQR